MKQWSANIVFDIGGVLYEQATPDKIKALPGLTILHHCYELRNEQERPLHKLYVLSNACQETYELLVQQFPDFTEYFEAIILTHTLPYKKPHHTSYRHLLDQHDLHPAETIFIDDLHENIQAAEQCGMIGIHHASTEKTLKTLRSLGVL
jgi:FMN phosphatase YigB (HAD superfamily)